LNKNNFWTQNVKVREFEEKMAKLTGCKYAVLTSSGSSANTLIARHTKDTSRNPEKNIIVTNAVGWHTSVSPFIREGFNIKFIDVSLKDFNLDIKLLEAYLAKEHRKVKCVFLVSLLGIAADIQAFDDLCKKYNVELKLDNCESGLSSWKDNHDNWHNLSAKHTSSTSLYLGHILFSGGEGGFIFTNNEEEYIYYLMARSHGMVRCLEPYKDKLSVDIAKYRNPLVDSKFDFHLLGDNLRSTDINAYLGLLNLEKVKEITESREYLYKLIRINLNTNKYILPRNTYVTRNIPFCFPIVQLLPDKKKMDAIKNYCDTNQIERRSIVGSNLLRHKSFQYIDDYKNYPNAEYLHDMIYVGLYPGLDEKLLLNFIDFLNSI
jgi:CDP-6-deoxy-D-xylo-4-hexulose-3-dehydrase